MTDEQEIEKVLGKLAETVSDLEVRAWIKNFHNPRLIVFPDTSYSPANENACREVMEPYFQDLRDRGFTHTVVNESQIRILTDTTAIVHTSWTRYSGENPMENIGATYMFQKSANVWGVIMVTSYPSDAIRFK